MACRQLGYGDAIDIAIGAKYGEGSGPVLLDYVSCYGHESRIDECARGGWYDTDCDHSRDAGIKCKYLYICKALFTTTSTCSYGVSTGKIHLIP